MSSGIGDRLFICGFSVLHITENDCTVRAGVTRHINLQHFEPFPADVKATQDSVLRNPEFSPSCRYDRQVGSLQETPGKLKADATRSWRYKDPGYRHITFRLRSVCECYECDSAEVLALGDQALTLSRGIGVL